MKIALIAFAQFLLFLLIFLVGSFWHPFHLRWFVSHPTAMSLRFFVPDGLLLALAVYGLILLIALLRRRLAGTALWTSLALVLAVALGLYAQFGWKTIP
jgi:hypothetical protein